MTTKTVNSELLAQLRGIIREFVEMGAVKRSGFDLDAKLSSLIHETFVAEGQGHTHRGLTNKRKPRTLAQRLGAIIGARLRQHELLDAPKSLGLRGCMEVGADSLMFDGHMDAELAVALFVAIGDLRARLDGARVPTVKELLRSGYRRRPRGKVVAR